MDMLRYPRTPHLAGSKLQSGDSTEGQVPLSDLPDGDWIWEEKLDGSNVGVRFSEDADLLLQSRGHYLQGGGRERQFNLLKRWGEEHRDWLFDRLTDRYLMYGEWCYAKHTVFYDRLPAYLFEFDIYDRATGNFLSTERRHAFLRGGPVLSVPVVHTGRVRTVRDVRKLIKPSLYKSPEWRQTLTATAVRHKIDPAQAARDTDPSDLSEGLYLKIERDGRVIGRYKFVRNDFLQVMLDSGSHWSARPILPNRLALCEI